MPFRCCPLERVDLVALLAERKFMEGWRQDDAEVLAGPQEAVEVLRVEVFSDVLEKLVGKIQYRHGLAWRVV